MEELLVSSRSQLPLVAASDLTLKRTAIKNTSTKKSTEDREIKYNVI
jgi:hypothetical protein